MIIREEAAEMKADIQKSRAAALLLALCLIAVFSLSALFVVSHADHDCTGTDCAVCHEIHSCLFSILFCFKFIP